MTTEHLLGVDPGVATGVAHIDSTTSEKPCVASSAELSVQEYYEYLESFLGSYKGNCEVVIEAYVINGNTHKKSQQPASLKLIGATEYLCWKHEVPLTIQGTSKKAFATDAKLKKIGFWHKGGKGHALDALRHCLARLVEKDPQIAKLLI